MLVEAEPAPAAPDTTVATVGNVEAIEPIAQVATEGLAPSPLPERQVAPATTEVQVIEPVVVEFVEDEQA